MKPLLLLAVAFIAGLALQTPTSTDDSQVTVLGQRWVQDRLTVEQAETDVTIPAPAMIPQNKNFERARRANAPVGERDPNLDTIDGRSAALERSIQESRAPKPIEGYTYRVKLQNAGTKVIDAVFWEYRVKETSDSAYESRRQFLCGVSIRPGKVKELKGFSLSGPSDVVSVGILVKTPQKAFDEKVVINRVEFADRSFWQRKDWKFQEIKLTYARALQSSWAPDMCKAL